MEGDTCSHCSTRLRQAKGTPTTDVKMIIAQQTRLTVRVGFIPLCTDVQVLKLRVIALYLCVIRCDDDTNKWFITCFSKQRLSLFLAIDQQCNEVYFCCVPDKTFDSLYLLYLDEVRK